MNQTPIHETFTSSCRTGESGLSRNFSKFGGAECSIQKLLKVPRTHSPVDPDPEEVFDALLGKVGSRQFKDNTAPLATQACQLLGHTITQPLNLTTNVGDCLERCMGMIAAYEEKEIPYIHRRFFMFGSGEEKEKEGEDKDGAYSSVHRMCLSGEHSREFLLRAGVVCCNAEVLDLRNCKNLDERILDAMTSCCSNTKKLFLFGIKVQESCEVVKKLRQQGLNVNFSERA